MWLDHRHCSHISSVAPNFQDGDSQISLFHLWSPSGSWKLPVKCNDMNDMVVTDSSLFWSLWCKTRLKWVLPILQSHILNLFFSYKVKAVLDSNGTGPCPTLHSLGDKKGIDWAFKIYTWNCPDASANSKNETESSSVCPFTSHHRKTADTLPINPEQTTVIQMSFEHSNRDTAQMIYKNELNEETQLVTAAVQTRLEEIQKPEGSESVSKLGEIKSLLLCNPKYLIPTTNISYRPMRGIYKEHLESLYTSKSPPQLLCVLELSRQITKPWARAYGGCSNYPQNQRLFRVRRNISDWNSYRWSTACRMREDWGQSC